MTVRVVKDLEAQKRRLEILRAHIRPDGATAIYRWVSRDFDLVLKVALGWLRGHIDAITINIELPAVVHAAQAALFIAAEEKACTPVRAIVINEAYVTVGVTERYQLFAQQLGANGWAIWFREFLRR
jgi:hypothetical protein